MVREWESDFFSEAAEDHSQDSETGKNSVNTG